MTSIHAVHSDDSAWMLRYECDFDGIYPVEWVYLGFVAEPSEEIRKELERKAYSYFHERRAGAEPYEDDDERN